MADAEQVSSTTPSEVEGKDEIKPRTEESGFSEHTAAQDGNVGIFGGEHCVQEVQVQKADVEREEKKEEAVEVRKQQETEVHTPENKAETECLEKSVDSISKPVELESPVEPDSTQVLDEISPVQEVQAEAEEAVNLVDLKDVHEVPVAFTQAVPANQDQDLLVSTAAHHHEDIQKSSKPAEEIAFTPDFGVQDQDFGFGLKEEIFEAPVSLEKDLRSDLEEKKDEERWNPVVESIGIDSESISAASASPSADEPSLPSSTAAVASFPTLMQFTSVVELLYWRDVKSSGIVFGACLLLLLSLSACSIISVLSYVALALLSVTISFRIYKGVLQAIQKSDEGHPFKLYLEHDVSLPDEVVRKYSDAVLGQINIVLNELRRLFLVEDLVDSLKFAVLMWILTYVGALFNGLTLLILGLVALFTCPVVYEKHQVQIDHYIALVRNQVKDVVEKIQAKIPGAKKKAE